MIPEEVLVVALCDKYKCLPSDLNNLEARDYNMLIELPDIEEIARHDEELKNKLYLENKNG